MSRLQRLLLKRIRNNNKSPKTNNIKKKVLECTFFLCYNLLRVKKHVEGLAGGAM